MYFYIDIGDYFVIISFNSLYKTYSFFISNINRHPEEKMFLKKVEIFGFKSFPNRTKFVFDKGISAIIGPNGCGKTNVFDAVKWVLGEQSPKSVRSSRMEDVIFSGTNNRKRLGLAEVSLVFDNSKNILPIDFSEVKVTRKIYRDDQSEYYINKSLCRLRDVLELFMNTGVGVDAYSFLEQGKVDVIINSRPQDRRLIFEEASGIMKYNARKQEAVRKLDHTEQNLIRIEDIMKEVKRQVISINRQVGKAKRYKDLHESARGLELKLARKNYENFR